jgi:hypothetical protein
MRAFAILDLSARLTELDAAPVALPSIAGHIINVHWSPHEADEADEADDEFVEYRLAASHHWRLAVAFDTDKHPTRTEENAQRAADALGALIDLRRGGPPLDLPTVEIEEAGVVWRPTDPVSPYVEPRLRVLSDALLLDSLDRLETLLANPRLLRAAGFWQASVDFFAYKSVEWDEVLTDRTTRPAANLDRARMEAAYLGAWKAIEALIGEPNNDDRKFRARLREVGTDPDRRLAAFRGETPPAGGGAIRDHEDPPIGWPGKRPPVLGKLVPAFFSTGGEQLGEAHTLAAWGAQAAKKASAGTMPVCGQNSSRRRSSRASSRTRAHRPTAELERGIALSVRESCRR